MYQGAIMSSVGRNPAARNDDKRRNVTGFKRAINQSVGRVTAGCKPPQEAAERLAMRDLFISAGVWLWLLMTASPLADGGYCTT